MVTFTAEQIDRAVAMLQHLPGAAQQAMARAMNRAIEGARTTAAKQIRSEYRVTSAAVKATMRLERATPTRLQAEVRSTGPRLPLYSFGPTPDQPGTGGRFPGLGMTRPPLRVSVKRGGGKAARKVITGAFVARMGGRLHVAWRLGAKRKPIEPLFSAAIPQMMGVASVVKEIERVAQQRLDERLDHEISWALDKAAGRGR